MAEWERQVDEPDLWFKRFVQYLHNRSMLSVCNAERRNNVKDSNKEPRLAKRLPGSWSRNAAKWRWVERAKAWDKRQADVEKAEFEKERQRRRARRQKILEEGFVKLEKMIANVPVKKLSLHQISMYMDILMRHERIDYDDEPAQRVMLGDEEGNGVPIINFTIQKVAARVDGAARSDGSADSGDSDDTDHHG